MKSLVYIQNQSLVVSQDNILELLSFIDLTTLGNTDTKEDILLLIHKANQGFKGVHPAAVCTFSNYGDLVRKELSPHIKTAVVGGCFPTGQTLTAAKIEEARMIADTTIDEIDIVLNRSDFFNQNYGAIENEIKEIKSLIGEKHLKVILETGDLKTAENIRKAAKLAINGGADFIKTSTGKTAIGATPEAVYEMCSVIKKHVEKTGKKIGIKPSGGIRTTQDALAIYAIVENVLGSAWLSNTHFRIGASSLYDNLIKDYNQL